MSCVFKAKTIRDYEVSTSTENGIWIPARPLNSFYNPKFGRIRAAWNVLIGKYDALDWEDKR